MSGMRMVAALVAVAAVVWGGSARGGDVWLECDFGDATAYKELPKQEFVSGSLPTGWSDNSTWSKANCSYSSGKDGQISFLKIVGADKGAIQLFYAPLKELTEKRCFKLKVKARSPSKSTMTLGLRAMGEPYNFYASATIQPVEAWKDFEVMIAGGPATQKVGFFIMAPSPGTLEIARLALETAPLSDYTPPTTIAQTKEDGWWMGRHKSMVENAVRTQPEFMILGDSITQGWEGDGKAAWDASIAPLKAANFGIGGDRTEHLLWRIRNSGFGKDFKPKAVAILIGINNSWSNSSEDIAAGTAAVIKEIRTLSPDTKILLLGLFPTGEAATAPQRGKVKEINALYAKLADDKNVFFLDFGAAFLQPDGSLSKETMPDFLHLTAKGYATYAEKLLPKVKELLGKK